jgi:hypothetical protein
MLEMLYRRFTDICDYVLTNHCTVQEAKLHLTVNDDIQKKRKERTKKIYTVLTSPKTFNNLPILYPFFLSTSKENDINKLARDIPSNIQLYVEIMFTTGNFYFYLNNSKNNINITNLATFAFYRTLQRGEGFYINRFLTNSEKSCKEKFYKYIKELNELLLQYEHDMENQILERQIAIYYYYLTKVSNKQVLKYKKKQIISKYNNYVKQILPDPNLENEQYITLLNNTLISYSFDFLGIIKHYNNENVLMFIDTCIKKFDYYEYFFVDEEKIHDLFVESKSCIN